MPNKYNPLGNGNKSAVIKINPNIKLHFLCSENHQDDPNIKFHFLSCENHQDDKSNLTKAINKVTRKRSIISSILKLSYINFLNETFS